MQVIILHPCGIKGYAWESKVTYRTTSNCEMEKIQSIFNNDCFYIFFSILAFYSFTYSYNLIHIVFFAFPLNSFTNTNELGGILPAYVKYDDKTEGVNWWSTSSSCTLCYFKPTSNYYRDFSTWNFMEIVI